MHCRVESPVGVLLRLRKNRGRGYNTASRKRFLLKESVHYTGTSEGEPAPVLPIELSVVIPAYNEAKRIERTLAGATDYLNTLYPGGGYEILVVDDG